VQYDLVTKLSHVNCITLPKIKSINLNFGVRGAALSDKKILPSLLALEILTGQKGIITKSTKDLINWKIRKGMLIGCKVNIRKYSFISLLRKTCYYDFTTYSLF